MGRYKQKVLETAAFLKAHIRITPEIGLVTGTGLGDAAALIDISESFDYEKIPHFMTPTVESHHGKLLFGTRESRRIVVMQGRSHLYEGCTSLDVTFPIRVMKSLGVEILIVSNASGGLNPEFQPGDIMAITDHMNLTGTNPLTGPNEASWGPRFPDMSRAYDEELLHRVEKAAAEEKIRLQKGVYAGLIGPSLETPAEARFLRTIGADAVGFSTVQEVISAVHSGMRVVGLSIITNIHNPDAPLPANTDEIIAKAKETVPRLERILRRLLSYFIT